MSNLKGLCLRVYQEDVYKRIRDRTAPGRENSVIIHVAGGCREITLVSVMGEPLPLDSQVFTAGDDAPAFDLEIRSMGDQRVYSLRPVSIPEGFRGPMMGGAYASTSDSRFSALISFYGAVAIHDRCEIGR